MLFLGMACPSCFSLHLLVTPDSALLPPKSLSLALPPKLILFNYWPVSFLVKPVIVTYIYSHSVKENCTSVFVKDSAGGSHRGRACFCLCFKQLAKNKKRGKQFELVPG